MATVSSNLYNSLNDPSASTAPPPDAGTLGGSVRLAMGTIALGSAEAGAGDVIKLAPLPSNARPLSIVLFNDALDSGTTGTADLGLYVHDAGATVSGAAEDDDCFASAITNLRGAVTAGTEVVCEAGTTAVALFSKRIWEWAGLSADDHKLHDLCITCDAAHDQAGDLSFRIMYVVD
jgi:hypothetical protein